jgi:hypothetical protein
MDGSCNGLQHYAALGRDKEGGAAVNLLDGAAPRDVYKGVAAIVAERVEADAAKGEGGGGEGVVRLGGVGVWEGEQRMVSSCAWLYAAQQHKQGSPEQTLLDRGAGGLSSHPGRHVFIM